VINLPNELLADNFDTDLNKIYSTLYISFKQVDLFNKDVKNAQDTFTKDGKRRLAFLEEQKEKIKETMDDQEIDLVKKYLTYEIKTKEAYPDMIYKAEFIYLITLVDAFVADTFRATLFSKKEILKSYSNKEIKWGEILEIDDINDLHNQMVESIVSDLTHGSISETIDQIDKKLKLDLKSQLDMNKLKEIYATRNIIVHNGGIVNQIYKKTFPESTFNIGDKRIIDDLYFAEAKKVLTDLSTYLHILIRLKFHLGDIKIPNT
jgi:hypothetical protein